MLESSLYMQFFIDITNVIYKANRLQPPEKPVSGALLLYFAGLPKSIGAVSDPISSL